MSLKVGYFLERVHVPEFEIASTASAQKYVVIAIISQIVQRTYPVFVTVVYRL